MPKLTSVLLQQDEWTIIRDLGIDGVARNEAATFGMDADDLFDAFEEEAIEQPVLSVVAKRTRDDASAGTAKRQKEDSGSAVAADAGNAAAVPTAALKSEKDTATSNLDYSLPDTTPSQAFGTSAAASTAAGDDGGQHETIKTVLSRGDVDESKTTAADFDVEKTAAPAKRNESVLVSAHTSAGKTVVAEYAIAMALRDKQRVIYTSPIKALSNQKYRDLYEEMGDVGLMTGDVTINPNASCLVMTTEILRSMLYRGSEILREVAWVIYDEIHYMRDRERGVVWEESIIMLPHKVRFVFLSATIPNAKEFAAWVGQIHHQTCHVVYTEYRPTPLQHFLFPAGGEGVYLIVDDKGRFREDNFTKAMATLNDTTLEDQVMDVVESRGKKGRKKQRGKGPPDLYRIVKMIMERHYDPVIIFSFSKRETEANALKMVGLDFTSEEEKKLVEQVFSNAIDSLSEDDKQLPQVVTILPLLKRGIGIHHGGLLPILKEVIEILFQESLIKVLFATETFAMGINMPAKTVVFTASRKFDGTDFRWVSPGEYIQMSGRAGRRGLDDRGIVIQMIDEKMDPVACKQMVCGAADPLNSAFYLGYNMLMNLMRMEEADPETIMRQSFHQFQNLRAAPRLEAEIKTLTDEKNEMVIENEPVLAEYHTLSTQMALVRQALREVINDPQYCMPFLVPGRLVRVRDTEDWGWGVVVNYQKYGGKNGRGEVPAALTVEGVKSTVIVDVLLHCRLREDGKDVDRNAEGHPRPLKLSDQGKQANGEMRVVPVLLPMLDGISTVRIHMPSDLRAKDKRALVRRTVQEVTRRFPDGIPHLDPSKDLQIEDPAFTKLLKKADALEGRLAENAMMSMSEEERTAAYHSYEGKVEVLDKIKQTKAKLKQTRALIMQDDLQKMRRVLRRLGFTNAENVVQLKGRVACEIQSADELLLTELIFNGVFNDLDCGQCAALLSCLVYTDRGDEEQQAMQENLMVPLRQLQDTARRIAEVKQESKIELDKEEYVKQFRPDMMQLVFEWVNGAKFADIIKLTKAFEGTVIRCIRRLEELLRQLSDAAKVIGDEALGEKFKEASTKMKRDIIFAASLYL